MKLIVNPHKIEIEKSPVNEKEINITKVEFEFSEEITQDYVKDAYFTLNGTTYKEIINNNECDIPYEVLNKQGQVEIGVVAYLVENEEEIKRYNPSPAYISTLIGSLKEEFENTEPVTPSDKEQIEQAIQNNTNSINELEDTKVDKVEGKGLSTNDYTNEEKTKLASLENYDDTEIKADILDLQTNKADKNEIPTTLAELTDDDTHRLVTDSEKTIWNNKADISDIPDVSSFITKEVNNLTYYTLKTSTGSLINLEINSSTYVITLSLKDIDGNVISTDTIDLPLESVVVSGSFDSVNKKIVLTLQNGNTVDIPVGDLVAGLQTEITSTNKLNADYVDDSNSGNKFTNTSEKTAWNAKYDKPSGGIPSTDLASAVQTSLGKADTALQSETDPVFSASASASISASDITNWNNKQNALTFDTTPTSGSTNPVTSGGIYTYVNNIVGDINTALDTINGEVI